jgi:hypothetical protein
MGSKEFPGFHGATVEKSEDRNEFVMVLPMETAPDGRIVVRIRGGDDMDPQILYETAKRDMLETAAQYANADDKGIWQERYDSQQKIVRLGQIKRPYLAGEMDAGLAMNRLVAAGFTPFEAAKALDMEEGE